MYFRFIWFLSIQIYIILSNFLFSCLFLLFSILFSIHIFYCSTKRKPNANNMACFLIGLREVGPQELFFLPIDGSPRLKEWNQKKTYLCAHSPKKHWWLWLHWRWTHCDCSKIFIEKKPWGWENWGFENTEGEMLTAFHIAVMFTFFGQAGSLLEPLVML